MALSFVEYMVCSYQEISQPKASYAYDAYDAYDCLWSDVCDLMIHMVSTFDIFKFKISKKY